MHIPEQVTGSIKCASRIVALTGAGMSVESGIAPFRGKGGLWEKFDPEEYAHIAAFEKDPEKSWELFRLQYEEISKAEPNPGHHALIELQKHGLEAIITQNIDGLHHNQEVVELHGNIFRSYCTGCGTKYHTREFMKKPILCGCGAPVRPDVVLFGETLSQHSIYRAFQLCADCDLLLVIGTSAVVHPAASLPSIAKQAGAEIVEINLDKTPLTGGVADISVFGEAGNILQEILRAL